MPKPSAQRPADSNPAPSPVPARLNAAEYGKMDAEPTGQREVLVDDRFRDRGRHRLRRGHQSRP